MERVEKEALLDDLCALLGLSRHELATEPPDDGPPALDRPAHLGSLVRDLLVGMIGMGVL